MTSTFADSRLIPTPDTYSQKFWEACKQHELRVQRCRACHQLRFYPTTNCTHCLSPDTDWEKMSGRGSVYAVTVVHRPLTRAFAADVPYVVAVIELEEGIRMMSNVIGCPAADVSIGMPVEVVFEDVSDTISLPKFRPRQN